MQRNQRNKTQSQEGKAIKKSLDIIKDYILNTEPTLKDLIIEVRNESRIPINEKRELIKALNKLKNEDSVGLQKKVKVVLDKLGTYQNLKNSFQAKFTQIKTVQSLTQVTTPKRFETADNTTPQIKSNRDNIHLPFSSDSNYRNLKINIQPQANIFTPQVIKYDSNPPAQKFNLQDVIYTASVDENFMRSEPNAVVFWSRCDFSPDDLTALQGNDFWGPSFNQNIWGDNGNDTFSNRNAPRLQNSYVKGAQSSDVVAHSLKRHTLRDIWRLNIDNGKFAKGSNVPVFNEMSRLLAERASGEVIFVSGDKDSTTNKYGNTWENIEKPTLMKNPKGHYNKDRKVVKIQNRRLHT